MAKTDEPKRRYTTTFEERTYVRLSTYVEDLNRKGPRTSIPGVIEQAVREYLDKNNWPDGNAVPDTAAVLGTKKRTASRHSHRRQK